MFATSLKVLVLHGTRIGIGIGKGKQIYQVLSVFLFSVAQCDVKSL